MKIDNNVTDMSFSHPMLLLEIKSPAGQAILTAYNRMRTPAGRAGHINALVPDQQSTPPSTLII